jgi:hypothetical protein
MGRMGIGRKYRVNAQGVPEFGFLSLKNTATIAVLH